MSEPIDMIELDAEDRMEKSIEALVRSLARIRTGRASPALVANIEVDYYGSPTPLSQVANIGVEDARTLTITPWEKSVVRDIERAIMKSDLGLTPNSAGQTIRLPLPALTEETRRDLTRVARNEAEGGRVAVRSVRRDANSGLKDLLRGRDITEDELHDAEERIQKLTDRFIAQVDKMLQDKETDLLEF